ncbi:hypothetical protein L6164_026075 [Bauhinia variegata]|uniref:Uncharacterized protein n=1 Tax=Bauhinia variegata TaxID=167791 RepID=A0ACB9M2Y4_BAUVA|nr:hypothetical protein L6164_026075 [Bauhinia variegata]
MEERDDHALPPLEGNNPPPPLPHLALRNKLRAHIVAFQQSPGEFLHSVWERFQELLRRCHGLALEEWRQMEIFYQECNVETQVLIDATCGGTLANKILGEGYELIELLASNHHQTTNDKEQKREVLEIGTLDATLGKN